MELRQIGYFLKAKFYRSCKNFEYQSEYISQPIMIISLKEAYEKKAVKKFYEILKLACPQPVRA